MESLAVHHHQSRQTHYESTTHLATTLTTCRTLKCEMRANTMEYGATTMGCAASTLTASSVGMFPAASVANALPFSSMTWLLRLPSLGVRWYSSLTAPAAASSTPVKLGAWTCRNFLPPTCFLAPCLCAATAPWVVTETWVVVLPLRLISSRVIPGWTKRHTG